MVFANRTRLTALATVLCFLGTGASSESLTTMVSDLRIMQDYVAKARANYESNVQSLMPSSAQAIGNDAACERGRDKTWKEAKARIASLAIAFGSVSLEKSMPLARGSFIAGCNAGIEPFSVSAFADIEVERELVDSLSIGLIQEEAKVSAAIRSKILDQTIR